MLYDSESMRRFARIELGEDRVPDETTILKFRHLLERHQLTAQMFAAVNTLLSERRLLLKAGTLVDATIIAAPSSTKNATKTRDPEMKQTRKGNQWYFGMKLHIGTDRRGVIHSVVTTHAAAADITQLPYLLHGQETTLHGDKAYDKAEDKLQWELSGGRYLVNKSGPRTTYKDAINRTRSKTRYLRSRGDRCPRASARRRRRPERRGGCRSPAVDHRRRRVLRRIPARRKCRRARFRTRRAHGSGGPAGSPQREAGRRPPDPWSS
jgi:IS5 family transposase